MVGWREVGSGEVSRGEKMLSSGNDPESQITEYTSVTSRYSDARCRYLPLAPVWGVGFMIQGSSRGVPRENRRLGTGATLASGISETAPLPRTTIGP